MKAEATARALQARAGAIASLKKQKGAQFALFCNARYGASKIRTV